MLLYFRYSSVLGEDYSDEHNTTTGTGSSSGIGSLPSDICDTAAGTPRLNQSRLGDRLDFKLFLGTFVKILLMHLNYDSTYMSPCKLHNDLKIYNYFLSIEV